MGLYVRHRSSLAHDTGGHPECADRILAIERELSEADWLGLDRLEAEPATREQVTRVHTPAHYDRIGEFCATGGGMIDMDTIAVDASWDAARRAAGGAAEAAERMLSGEDRYGFVGMRPPGHHAESDRAMGFCLINNAAVAARHAIAAAGAERVLILDWDVHHGNGTEEIFAADPDVLYASIHQSPLYPGTGSPLDFGTGDGTGQTINMPVPAGTGGEHFLSLLQHVVEPVARSFDPGLIILSAGYDAHADDPLANCELLDADYGALSAAIAGLASDLEAPVLVCLEGGYDTDALARSVIATLEALERRPEVPTADPALSADAALRISRHWPVLSR